ncbi:MAG TPA: MOSC domain-containing protein [Isosphaeraceae bacterium]|nr:MOSC domain-containing protein [Isosphaeraceae bacterium]
MRTTILRSIQVGLPRDLGRDDAEGLSGPSWTSGIVKEPVAGPVPVGRTGVQGDGQADRVNHGGPDKAVCAYSADHYDAWRRELDRPSLAFGAFGENFTIEGLTEGDVCLGDVWRVGAVEVQVSQPRQPCWKLARRWRIEDLARRVVQNGRTGWYFRVLRGGVVARGLALERLDRPFPRWTIERANRVLHHDQTDLGAAAELAAIATLPAPLRASLSRRVGREPGGSDLVGGRSGATAHD